MFSKVPGLDQLRFLGYPLKVANLGRRYSHSHNTAWHQVS